MWISRASGAHPADDAGVHPRAVGVRREARRPVNVATAERQAAASQDADPELLSQEAGHEPKKPQGRNASKQAKVHDTRPRELPDRICRVAIMVRIAMATAIPRAMRLIGNCAAVHPSGLVSPENDSLAAITE
jgi:hypothetical protein